MLCSTSGVITPGCHPTLLAEGGRDYSLTYCGASRRAEPEGMRRTLSCQPLHECLDLRKSLKRKQEKRREHRMGLERIQCEFQSITGLWPSSKLYTFSFKSCYCAISIISLYGFSHNKYFKIIHENIPINIETSLVAQTVKESAWNAGNPASIPGSGRTPEKGMATHSSILAKTIPWTEEPGRLPSMGLERVGHDLATNTHFFSSSH